MDDETVSRLAEYPPGSDDENPYENIDLSSLPEWWRRNVEEFAAHGMRPYRPPEFADGTYTPPVIVDLEAELDVSIQFRCKDPQAGNDWVVAVDGDAVVPVERRRTADGYTCYDLSAAEFKSVVRDAL